MERRISVRHQWNKGDVIVPMNNKQSNKKNKEDSISTVIGVILGIALVLTDFFGIFDVGKWYKKYTMISTVARPLIVIVCAFAVIVVIIVFSYTHRKRNANEYENSFKRRWNEDSANKSDEYYDNIDDTVFGKSGEYVTIDGEMYSYESSIQYPMLSVFIVALMLMSIVVAGSYVFEGYCEYWMSENNNTLRKLAIYVACLMVALFKWYFAFCANNIIEKFSDNIGELKSVRGKCVRIHKVVRNKKEYYIPEYSYSTLSQYPSLHKEERKYKLNEVPGLGTNTDLYYSRQKNRALTTWEYNNNKKIQKECIVMAVIVTILFVIVNYW